MHRNNSGFFKLPAPPDQMNILPFTIFSASTGSHLTLSVTKLVLPPTLFHVSFSPVISAPGTVPSQREALLSGPAIPVPASLIPAIPCWERADALAGLGAVASGKPLLINQIRRVIALITINMLDRDDADAVQSLSDSKYTHASQHSHTQPSGHPCSSPDPPRLTAALSSLCLCFWGPATLPSPACFWVHPSSLPHSLFPVPCLYSSFFSSDVIWRAALRDTHLIHTRLHL